MNSAKNPAGNSTTLPAPLVTVVIPAFNVADYIRDAVESALAQTVRDIEVLVVDDGSVDGTGNRLTGINDSRLQVLKQKNAGLAAARNAGVERARGEFLSFLDGDDLWLPEKLARHLQTFARYPDVDVTYSLSRMINAHGGEIGFVVPQREGEVSFCDLFGENFVRNGSAAVLRMEVLRQAGPFDTSLIAGTDLDMWLRIASMRRGNFYCIAECLTLYRRRPGQATADWRRMEVAWQQVLGKARAVAPKNVGRLESRANSDKYFYFACLAYENKTYDVAFQLLSKSYRFSPRNFLLRVRPWLLTIACCSGRVLPSAIDRALVDCGVECARRVSRLILLCCSLFQKGR